jgi:hypothetical protein
MISAHSMENVELAFHKAIRGNLVRDTGDGCEIAAVQSGPVGKDFAHKLLLITISSFVFRLIVIFRIIDNPATRAYYLRADRAQTLDEVFAEVANLCSGALNRELSVNFPHLAMSTPYTLSDECLAFLGELRPQHVARFGITINGSVQLQATLCMCCSRPVEVAAASAAADEADARIGELELF